MTLKPCPFCGKQPSEEFFQRRYDFDFAIECECGACMSMCEWEGGHGKSTREETIAQWNTRAPATHNPTPTEIEAARMAYFTASDRGPIDAKAWMRAALIAYEAEKGKEKC